MAASMSDENNKSSESKDENSGSEYEFGDDWTVDSDTSDPTADSDQPSMFCRSCLSPYEGDEMQGGNFILRCTKCDHRDVIPAEDLHDTVYINEPEMLAGDLLNNRFKRILKAQEKLKKIDVQNPDYIDDQYRKYFHLHPKIFELMNTSIHDMHVVVNDYRKEHNEKMIDKIVERRSRQLDEGVQDGNEIVEVIGTTKDGTLIVSPDEFVVPDNVKIKCFRIGKVGVREADQMVLENGIPNESIESMPLFKERIKVYNKRMEQQSEKRDTETAGCAIKSKARNRTSNGQTNYKHDIHISNDRNTKDRCKNGSSILLVDIDEDNRSQNVPESRKKHRKNKTNSREEQETSIEPKKDTKARTHKLSTEVFLESIPLQKPKPLTPEEIKLFEGQNIMSQYVLQDLDEIRDLNDFVIDKANDAFTELLTSLSKLREESLVERRESTIKYIETTVASMSTQVDVVRDEIIEELKDAYKSKIVRTNRQKKQLEEAKDRVEGYGKLLQHYQETGQDDKLYALVEELGKQNFKN